MPDSSMPVGYGALVTLALLIACSVWLGTVAQRIVRRSSFVKSYFLGNRGLGSWALALTATVQSGGTFMGYPSLIYTYGWSVALWISAYMVVPLTGFALIGKRLAQLSRRSSAITVPDLFRERFNSPRVGLVALLFILLFMSFMMVAQFKAGALIMKIAWPGSNALALTEDANAGFDRYYYLGLVIFAVTVVGYTLIGGFLAAVWTDLFQSVMMLVGVLMLLLLTVPLAGGLSAANQTVMSQAGVEYMTLPGYPVGQQVFLPLSLAFSFFFVWVFAGLGSPAGVVRIMACRSTQTIRQSIFLLSSYNYLIYIPLIFICVCGKALLPDVKHSDEIIPRLAVYSTQQMFGGSYAAGLILTAPFGAVMATVSSYLVVIASGLVRDVYQRFLRPQATYTEIRRLTYLVMFLIGLIAFCANLYPVKYLQAIVVFSGSGAACAFVTPLVMACYWRRATAAGAIAGMLIGAGTCIGLYATGWVMSALHAQGMDLAWLGFDPTLGQDTSFRPYYLLGIDPIVWGLLASLMAGVGVSLKTSPPDEAVVSRMFDVLPEAAAPAGEAKP